MRETCNEEVYHEVSDRVNVSVSKVREIAKFIARYTHTRISIGRMDIIRYPGLGSFKPSIEYLQRVQEINGENKAKQYEQERVQGLSPDESGNPD